MKSITQTPNCLQKGSGGLKHYKYWTNKITLRTKKDILEALRLNLKVFRKDKIMGTVAKFNYKTNDFEDVQKCQ